METRTPYQVNTPLKSDVVSSKMSETPPIDWRAFLEMRLRIAQTEVTMLRQILEKPHYCPHCKCELK